MEKSYMTLGEFAEIYGISLTTAKELRRAKGFPPALKIGRNVRLSITEVDAYMRNTYTEVTCYTDGSMKGTPHV